MVKPLAIDLFTGLHGFGDAAASEGYRVVGFDIADMCRSTGRARNPNVQLVLQDVLTIHGSQFRDADLIWASPPCQQYSWLAMPWSRSKPAKCKACGGSGKFSKIAEAIGVAEISCIKCGGRGETNNSQKAKALRARWESEGPDNRLFEACFRIQREASEAAGRHIPMVVENVRGAQEWVGAVFYGLDAWMKASREERWRMGRSVWNYGSFHLWGDVPALMPIALKVPPKRAMDDLKNGVRALHSAHLPIGEYANGRKGNEAGRNRGWTAGTAISLGLESFGARSQDGVKQLHSRGDNQTCGKHRMGLGDGEKAGHPERSYRNGHKSTAHLTNPAEHGVEGNKIGGDWFRDPACHSKHGSRSSARKAASALIARIPEALASHIARVYYPR